MIVAIIPLILASSFIFCSLTFCKYLIFTSSPDSAAEIIQEGERKMRTQLAAGKILGEFAI